MQEQVRALEWLMTTLKASSGVTSAATAGIFDTMAPVTTPSSATYCIVQRQNPQGTDLTAGGHRRVMNRTLWTVKLVGPRSNYAALAAGADAIDTALDRQRGTASGGVILACVREYDVDYRELVNGVLIAHIGGQFTVWAQ
jgi:hypothetical protein